jgi:CheY-like chemotaxis protein
MPDNQERDLSGLRILLVEDEFLVFLQVRSMLTSLACEVSETASTLAEALVAAQNCNVDVALLDINLGGQKIYPAAQVLKRRSIPIVFSTGYGLAGIDLEWREYSVLQKPFALDALVHALVLATSSL